MRTQEAYWRNGDGNGAVGAEVLVCRIGIAIDPAVCVENGIAAVAVFDQVVHFLEVVQMLCDLI